MILRKLVYRNIVYQQSQ